MEPEIVERVSTLETDVAVIKSNYVRKDEFTELREEVRAGFAKLEAKIEAKVDIAVVQTVSTVLKWVFASQLTVAALFFTALKYL